MDLEVGRVVYWRQCHLWRPGCLNLQLPSLPGLPWVNKVPPSLFLNPGLRNLAKGVDRRKDVSGFASVTYHRCKESLVGFT